MLQRIQNITEKYIYRQRIAVRLMLLISIVIFLTILGLGGLYIGYEQDNVITASRRTMQYAVQMQKNAIGEWQEEREDDVATAAGLSTVVRGDINGINHDFKTALQHNKDINNYILVGRDGVTLADQVSPPGTDLSDREYIQRSLQGKAASSDILINRMTGQKVIVFSHPVKEPVSGEVSGVVLAVISIDTLQEIISQLDLQHSGIAYLVDKEGQVIAHSGQQELDVAKVRQNEGVKQVLGGAAAVQLYTNQHGRRVIGAYQWLPQRQWGLVCEIDEAEVLAPFYEQLQRGCLWSLLIFAIALYFTWQIAQSIEQPISVLVKSTRRTERGDYSYMIHEEKFLAAPLEVRELCSAFNIMLGTTHEHITLLYETNEALARAEKKYRLLSIQDPLTQIYNRTYFEMEISRLQKRQEVPVSVIGLDVDGLKLVNDTLGHKAGDDLIRAAADAIRHSFGEKDTVARVGGDEFVVLMPGADAREMQAGIARVQEAVLQHNRQHPQLPLVISLGGATASKLPLRLDEVISQADSIMYQEKNLNRAYNRKILLGTLMQAAALYDGNYSGHIEGVQRLAIRLGHKLGLDGAAIELLELTARYHDIGKICLTPELLTKKEPLTPEERDKIQEHSEHGARIARAVPELQPIAELILTHHERWDGGGYPGQLAGEDIPLLSRIVHIADAYDSMQRHTAYRPAKTADEAREEIRREAGLQFDPRLAAIFLAALEG